MASCGERKRTKSRVQVDNLHLRAEHELSEGLPVPESRAVGASGATMAERSGHAVNGGLEGRRERPATGMGSPEREDDG